jgi:predicted RNA binding protein YcfA (HicA-like mRNA interferase family)
MPKLRRMSGDDVAAILSKYGFIKISQSGSHMKLKRFIAVNAQTLTIPSHRELDTGTLRAIIRQASKFIPEQELQSHFYSS